MRRPTPRWPRARSRSRRSSRRTTSRSASDRSSVRSIVMLLIAHRGAPTQSTENTLRSILIAQRRKADGVEFDVRSTRDGVPVLLHDKTLQRLWGRPEAIDQVNLAEVRRLEVRG